MQFEWDEDKRLANLEKHGFDFAVAQSIWQGGVIDPASTRAVGEEVRYLALGVPLEHDIIIAVVYMDRGDKRRLISARRARDYERKIYQSRFGTGG